MTPETKNINLWENSSKYYQSVKIFYSGSILPAVRNVDDDDDANEGLEDTEVGGITRKGDEWEALFLLLYDSGEVSDNDDDDDDKE